LPGDVASPPTSAPPPSPLPPPPRPRPGSHGRARLPAPAPTGVESLPLPPRDACSPTRPPRAPTVAAGGAPPGLWRRTFSTRGCAGGESTLDETCPVSTGGGTRRVQSVREEGRERGGESTLGPAAPAKVEMAPRAGGLAGCSAAFAWRRAKSCLWGTHLERCRRAGGGGRGGRPAPHFVRGCELRTANCTGRAHHGPRLLLLARAQVRRAHQLLRMRARLRLLRRALPPRALRLLLSLLPLLRLLRRNARNRSHALPCETS
jgi:hypothetical protein